MDRRFMRAVQVLAAVFTAFLVDGAGHAFLPASPYMDEGQPSALAIAIGKIPVAMGMVFLLFLGIALTFIFLRHRLGGISGLRFCLAMSLFWFAGMFESVGMLASPLQYDLIMGLNDALPILLLGFLLDRLCGFPRGAAREKDTHFLSRTLWVTALYFLGRVFLYRVVGVESGILQRPWETLIWTLAMGLAVAITVSILVRDMPAATPLKQASIVGAAAFGVNWTLYNLFIPAVFAAPVGDFLIRSLVDAAAVFLAIFLAAVSGSKRRFG